MHVTNKRCMRFAVSIYTKHHKNISEEKLNRSVPSHRSLVAGLSPRRHTDHPIFSPLVQQLTPFIITHYIASHVYAPVYTDSLLSWTSL